jgi:hypothetical protein
VFHFSPASAGLFCRKGDPAQPNSALQKLTARQARRHATRPHLRTQANPCLPYAPPVEDAEQSASSQPTPSRRKPCPAPAVGEPATTSPQFPGQSTTRHCALITNLVRKRNGSISGKTRTHASAAALPFASCTSAFVALSDPSSLPLRAAYSRRLAFPQSCGRLRRASTAPLRVSFGTVCSPMGCSRQECTASLEKNRCCLCLL